ncbi:MAG: CapA family protein [Clostridia bacterium]|nr:CapA family protein [Clostridia bacterium]
MKKKVFCSILIFVIVMLCFTACADILDYGEKNTQDLPGKPEQKEDIKEQGEEVPEQETEEQPEPTRIEKAKITAVGDIMMHNTQIWAGHDKSTDSYNFDHFFEDIKEYINSSDLAIANLETTLAGKDREYTGYPMFNAPEQLADALKEAGFDVITTANNHSLDRREYGVVKTIDHLERAGLKHTGTYRTEQEYDNILITDVNGIKISILSYTYGTNGIPLEKPYLVNLIDMNKIKSDVDKAKTLGSDLIISCMHFGDEYQRQPSDQQKQIVDSLFGMGVDIVLGSHPHVLQPMEIREVTDQKGRNKKVFAIYSLGNFISAQNKQFRDSGIILNIQVEKNFNDDVTEVKSVDYIPTWVNVYNAGGAKKYRVVAVQKAINDYEAGSDSLLNKTDYNRLKAVWDESTQHMDRPEQKIATKNIE